jgi:hypothetical protein
MQTLTLTEETLPPRDRVRAHERVHARDVLRRRVGVLRVLVLVRRTVYAIEPVQDLFERRRELVIGGVAARPERVPADGRDCVLVQVRVAGGEV